MQPKSLLLLVIALSLISFSFYQNKTIDSVVPTPSIIVPDLRLHIYYNDYDKCKNLAELYNKKLLLVFTAEWCQYCTELKKDIDYIDSFKNYIVCIIDIDRNKNLIDKYRIKGLPTSLILDKKNNELSRKTGYKIKEYNEWLANNSMEGCVSWILTK